MLILHTCGTQIPSRHAANILLLDDAIWTAWLSFFTRRKILGERGREGKKKNQLCTYMYAYFKQNYCFCLDKCSKSTKFWFRCSKIQNNCVKIVRFRLFIWEKTGTEKVRYKGSKTKGQKNPEKGIMRHVDDAQSYLRVPTGSLALDHCSLNQDNEP